MDRRKRNAAAAVENARTTRASSKSPSRRSSRNRSPARTASPARTKSSASQRRSGRNKTDNDTASETDDSKSEVTNKVSIRVSPIKTDKEGIQKLLAKNRKTPTSGKVSNLSNDGDDEVASLTAKYLNDKQSAGNPTPSDLSAKRSYSRSISRSLIDEEWSQSDTSEKNDDPIYGNNRITRSRSKTQKLARREQSLAKDGTAEFGGRIGASLLILLLPILCFSTQVTFITLHFLDANEIKMSKMIKSTQRLELTFYLFAAFLFHFIVCL